MLANIAMALAQCEEVLPMRAFQMLRRGDCLGAPMEYATLQIVVVVEPFDSIIGGSSRGLREATGIFVRQVYQCLYVKS